MMDWGDGWPFGLCGIFAGTVDDWQARALAAEQRVEALVYEQRACHADKVELDAKLLAAEADVARLREALTSWVAWVEYQDRMTEPDDPLIVMRNQVHGGRIAQSRAALTTPTPGDAVAALVRAARDVCMAGEGEWGTRENRLAKRAALAALLDTPPWRDLR